MWSLRGGTLVPQRLCIASPLSVTLPGTRLLGLVCRGDQQLTGFDCPGFASKKNGPAFARGLGRRAGDLVLCAEPWMSRRRAAATFGQREGLGRDRFEIVFRRNFRTAV